MRDCATEMLPYGKLGFFAPTVSQVEMVIGVVGRIARFDRCKVIAHAFELVEILLHALSVSPLRKLAKPLKRASSAIGAAVRMVEDQVASEEARPRQGAVFHGRSYDSTAAKPLVVHFRDEPEPGQIVRIRRARATRWRRLLGER